MSQHDAWYTARRDEEDAASDALSHIRAREDAREITPAEAAAERIQLLQEHLDRLRQLRAEHQRPADDEDEPYCVTCGAALSIFQGQRDKGWQHYRGNGTAASPVEIYDAGHAPQTAWRPAGDGAS